MGNLTGPLFALTRRMSGKMIDIPGTAVVAEGKQGQFSRSKG